MRGAARPLLHAAQPSDSTGSAGFTLIELMLTIIIVAVLAAVALPAYQSQMIKGRRSDAVNALSAVQQAQERLRANQPSYSESLSDLGVSANSQGGHYAIELTKVTSSGYVATATPKSGSPQAHDKSCVQMALTMAGGNAIYSALNADKKDSSQDCWPK